MIFLNKLFSSKYFDILWNLIVHFYCHIVWDPTIILGFALYGGDFVILSCVIGIHVYYLFLPLLFFQVLVSHIILFGKCIEQEESDDGITTETAVTRLLHCGILVKSLSPSLKSDSVNI